VEARIEENGIHQTLGTKIQKPHQPSWLIAAVGENTERLSLDYRLPTRPVERATTRDAYGRGENMLHGVNIEGDHDRVKPPRCSR
jgi:hypothetical protein